MEQTKRCSNCKREISAEAFVTHELHCKRNLTLCEICEEPVPRSEIKNHLQTEHAPVPCDLCGTNIPRHEMDKHQEENCPKVKKECKYCELDIARDQYEEHTESCGSRTDFCELCNQRVLLRDMQDHLVNKCQKKLGENSGFGHDPYSHEPGLMDRHGYPDHGMSDLPPSYQAVYANGGNLPGFGHQASPPSPPKYGNHEQGSVQVDPQWLASVSGACMSEDLGQVVAHNFRLMETHGRGHGNLGGDKVEFNQGLGFYEGTGPNRRTREEEQEIVETETRDEELAMRIHEQENAYKPAHHHRNPGELPSSKDLSSATTLSEVGRVPWEDRPVKGEDGGQGSSESDTEMAQRLHERDREFANRSGKGGYPGQEHWVDVDEDQGWHRGRPNSGGRPSTSTGSARGLPNASDPSLVDQASSRTRSPLTVRKTEAVEMEDRDAILAMELHQREQEYVTRIEVDRKLAEQMQQAENRNKKIEENRARQEEDREFGGGARTHTEWPEYGQGGDNLAVAKRLLSKREREESYDYNQEVLMNEEPRPKTPEDEKTEDEGKVPCQYCAGLFPFKTIMDHQKRCLEDGPSEAAKRSEELFSCVRRPDTREDVMLTEETLRQISSDELTPFYNQQESQMRTCSYCKEEMMLARLATHEVVCPANPDTLSREAHQKLFSSSPHPPSPDLAGGTADVGRSDTVVYGPCEFCEEQIPVASLVKHESTCHLRFSSSRNHPSTQSGSQHFPPSHPQAEEQAGHQDSSAVVFSRSRLPRAGFPQHMPPQMSYDHHNDPQSDPAQILSREPVSKHSSGVRTAKPSVSSQRKVKSMKREEEIVYSTRLRSEPPPLSVVGEGIDTSTRPAVAGGSRSRRTDQQESIRSSLRQPSLGPRTISTSKSHNTGSSDSIKKPLDMGPSGLRRKPLRGEFSHGNNGYI